MFAYTNSYSLCQHQWQWGTVQRCLLNNPLIGSTTAATRKALEAAREALALDSYDHDESGHCGLHWQVALCLEYLGDHSEAVVEYEIACACEKREKMFFGKNAGEGSQLSAMAKMRFGGRVRCSFWLLLVLHLLHMHVRACCSTATCVRVAI